MDYMDQGLKITILHRYSKSYAFLGEVDFGALVKILAVCIWKTIHIKDERLMCDFKAVLQSHVFFDEHFADLIQ